MSDCSSYFYLQYKVKLHNCHTINFLLYLDLKQTASTWCICVFFSSWDKENSCRSPHAKLQVRALSFLRESSNAFFHCSTLCSELQVVVIHKQSIVKGCTCDKLVRGCLRTTPIPLVSFGNIYWFKNLHLHVSHLTFVLGRNIFLNMESLLYHDLIVKIHFVLSIYIQYLKEGPI